MMNVKDHIALVENAFPEEVVDGFLSYYKLSEKTGRTIQRQKWEKSNPLQKSDHAISLTWGRISGKNLDTVDLAADDKFLEIFFGTHWKEYCDRYPILYNYSQHTIYDFKIQKTRPGEGYHVWHTEDASPKVIRRIAAFSLFLNTVEEGGETEFLNQNQRYKPKRNSLLIFPAAYTHVHRGNPPLEKDKYLLTGWVEFGIR
jgi:hypothetical protein